MNYANKAENRNTTMTVSGIIIALFGMLDAACGYVYVFTQKTTAIVLSKVQDSWMGTLADNRQELILFGLILACFGFLLKWRGEDAQNALEKTNRFVAYEPRR